MFSTLSRTAEAALQKRFSLKKPLSVPWQKPQEQAHGDAATAAALSLAKILKKKPLEIAAVIREAMEGAAGIAKAEVAGAGYVNVWLKPAAFLVELTGAEEACRPQAPRKGEKPVIVDYSQPNIAKPLGVHHLLTTIIGQALVNIHRHVGIPVVALNYIGDWGTQFGKLAVAQERWGKKSVADSTIEELLALYVRFHAEAEKEPSLEDEARAAFARLERGDKELRAFWQQVVDVSLQGLDHLYKRLHVSFDSFRGESYYEGKMGPVLEEGRKKGIFVPGEQGALIAQFPESMNLPPAIVLKADQATIYLTRDIAAVKDRRETWHPQAILYVVDSAQSLHFQQLFAIVDLLGWGREGLEHTVFGRMRFTDKTMSTRRGQFLRLEEALDEAVARAKEVIAEHRETIQTDNEEALAEMMGTGALVYGILSQNRKLDIVFDWKKVLSLEGNSAPYLQYTYARARSVLRKAGEDVPAAPEDAPALTDRERSLAGLLLGFGDALEEARAQRMPHILAHFLYELCQAFNGFYNTEPILKASGRTRALRLFLTSLTSRVLKAGAEILTLRVPEKM